jgi:hypothetical protein
LEPFDGFESVSSSSGIVGVFSGQTGKKMVVTANNNDPVPSQKTKHKDFAKKYPSNPSMIFPSTSASRGKLITTVKISAGKRRTSNVLPAMLSPVEPEPLIKRPKRKIGHPNEG